MDIEQKELLARRHDGGLEACSIRLRAARVAIGKKQSEAGADSGVGTTAWNNAENARNYPPLKAIRWMHRNHRIDYNFVYAGEFTQLPSDIQTALFAALEDISSSNESDRKSN